MDNSLEAHIIYKKDLDDFLKYYHEYSFLVPVGQAEKLNEELLRRSYGVTSVSHYPWLMRFKVTPLANGRQLLEVEYQQDDDHANVGWYETDGKEIIPKFHKRYFGPGLVFSVLPWAFAANVVLWGIGLGFYAYAYYKKPRLAKAAAG